MDGLLLHKPAEPKDTHCGNKQGVAMIMRPGLALANCALDGRRQTVEVLPLCLLHNATMLCGSSDNCTKVALHNERTTQTDTVTQRELNFQVLSSAGDFCIWKGIRSHRLSLEQ
eukprot:3657927-Amphidinium_carterae.1